MLRSLTILQCLQIFKTTMGNKMHRKYVNSSDFNYGQNIVTIPKYFNVV